MAYFVNVKKEMLILKDMPEMPEAGSGYTPMVLDISVGLGADGKLPEMMMVAPWGLVHTLKGDFVVDDEAVQMINHFQALRGNDTVIDYEHQSLGKTAEADYRSPDGTAPAAGWLKNGYVAIPGKGIFCKPEWTEKARTLLEKKEYRYWSPVVLKRESDNKLAFIHSFGLTNVPATFGIQPLVNKMGLNDSNNQQKELKTMEKLIQLLLSWGKTEAVKLTDFVSTLPAELTKFKDSTEQVALKDLFPALEQMMKRDEGYAKAMSGMVALKDVGDMLGLTGEVKLTDVKGNIMALKQPSGKFVSAEEFNTLKGQLAKSKATEMVEMALKGGKITSAQKEWALKEAEADPEAFQVFLNAQPEIVALKDRPGYMEPQKGVPGAGDGYNEVVCKQLGVSQEDIKKYGPKKSEVA